jgi:hypothetical protein
MFSILLSVAAQALQPSPSAQAVQGTAATSDASSATDATASATSRAATNATAANNAPSAATSAAPGGESDQQTAGPPRRPPFEFTAQVVLGGGARFAPGLVPAGVFTLAWRADMLFGRTTPRAFGIGPAIAARIDHFADVTPSLGASLLLPITEAFPLVLTPSFALRWDGTSLAPGASGRLFWGIRSHNYHGVYALSFGLWVEARHFFGVQNSTDIAAGIDVDLQLLAVPFVALYVELFRRTRAQ